MLLDTSDKRTGTKSIHQTTIKQPASKQIDQPNTRFYAMSLDSDEELPLAVIQNWISDPEIVDWIRREENAYEETPYYDPFHEEEEEKPSRVRYWSSSKSNLDGSGGFDERQSNSQIDSQEEGATQEIAPVRVAYIISEKNWQGFGDTVWASSRHLANQIADADKCRTLIPFLNKLGTDQLAAHHPLEGIAFVELGAGTGIPSWTAMHCGARVVCTDQPVVDRIRCMSESAERNSRLILEKKSDALPFLRVHPHLWGKSYDAVLRALNINGSERFKVVAAADCCYMPWLHNELLDSIENLLDTDEGVALITFALHGNTDDKDVWGIVDLAKQRGVFSVEVLESQQLTPPKIGMGSKQGLVHTVRLTR